MHRGNILINGQKIDLDEPTFNRRSRSESQQKLRYGKKIN